VPLTEDDSKSLLPYPGLRPFRKDEARLFFGQDEPLESLHRRVAEDRFVAIVGLSGSGKSSLLYAGLLADLEQQQVKGPRPRWLVGCMKPGADPLGRLCRIVEDIDKQLDPHETRDILTDLIADSHGLARFGRHAPLYEFRHEGTLIDSQRILIVVDQFEELFRYQARAKAGEKHQRRDNAALFVQLLLAAASDPDSRISVVLTMRSEFLGDCSLFYGLAEQVNGGTFLLPRMTRAQIEEVITGPAELAKFTVEPAVVQQLLNETESQEDGLPLLQHALRRIWERWRDEGGIGPISLGHLTTFERSYKNKNNEPILIKRHLNDCLNNIYKQLPEARQPVAEFLFRLLSEKDSNDRLTRRPVRFSRPSEAERDPEETAPTIRESLARFSEEDIRAVIEEFRDDSRGRTFLTPEAGQPLEGQIVDICHECLLRQWGRLGRWIIDEEADASQFRRFADDTDEAEKKALQLDATMKPIEGTPLDQYQVWRRKSQYLGPAWALRYEGAFGKKLGRRHRSWADTEDFLNWSLEQRKLSRQTRKDAKHRLRRTIAALVVFVLFVIAAILGWSQLREKRNLEATLKQTRARELTALAALSQDSDPTRALYLGLTAARMVSPPPPNLEGVLATALTNGVSYGLLPGGQGAVRDVRTGQMLHTLKGHKGLAVVAWRPNSTTLASLGPDGVRLWDSVAGQPLNSVPGTPREPEAFPSLAWSPNGDLLAYGGKGEIQFWNAENFQTWQIKLEVEREIYSIAWTPDGKAVAIAGVLKRFGGSARFT